MQIMKSLLANKCHVQPNVFIKPSLEKSLISRLRDIIKKHQGVISETEEDATHVIHGMPSGAASEGTVSSSSIVLLNKLAMGTHSSEVHQQYGSCVM